MPTTIYTRRKPRQSFAPGVQAEYAPVRATGYRFQRVPTEWVERRWDRDLGRTVEVRHTVDMTAHASQMCTLMGLPTNKLPLEGVPPRMVPGLDPENRPVEIKVWVDSRETARAAKRFQRMRCECPGCGADVPAGRLFSHLCREYRR